MSDPNVHTGAIERVDDPRFGQLQKLFAGARMASIDTEGAIRQGTAMVKRTAAVNGGHLSLAMGRPKDPLWYWRQSNVPYNIWEDPHGEEIRKVRELCRLLYITHPLLGSAIDIYSKYPLSGMEIVCPKDKSIADFYSQLFFDDLNYEEYMVDVGREHWLVGEAFPLASFNELTGVWDSDDLMLPEDVEVIKTPFANDPRFLMALPYNIRKILNERAPQLEYRQLVENYPELLAYNFSDLAQFGHRDERFLMPVSNKLMQHVKRTGDSFHPRGIPIMMRAFRAVAQEEMLNAAQDSIAQRLYTPLILAKIGASATDLGTTTPWVPTQGDLDAFVEDVNLALAADFRLIVSHFAVSMQNVFGRESMPNLGPDFDRLAEKELQAFGISKTMLSGGSGGETYAADALNRDLVTQLLSEYQRKQKKFFRKRCEIVAEAQGHYDFHMKGGRAVPLMETVQETDAETGEIRFVERPKLLLPDLRIKAMNMRDEKQNSDIIEGLRQSGVPISQRTRLVNVPIDLDEEIEATKQEQISQAVAAEEVRRGTYAKLKQQGLKIPQDLKDDYEPKVLGADANAEIDAKVQEGVNNALGIPNVPGQEEGEGDSEILPTVGTASPDTGNLVPTEDGEDTADDTENSPAPAREFRSRPPESDEQRKDMPKAAQFAPWVFEGSAEDWAQQHDGLETAWFDQSIVRRAIRKASGKEGDESEPTPETNDGLDPVEATLVELPVLGSYTMRFVGKGSKNYFYKGAQEPAQAQLPPPVPVD